MSKNVRTVSIDDKNGEERGGTKTHLRPLERPKINKIRMRARIEE